MDNEERRATLIEMCRAFNNRDIDGALAHMAPGVDWPNAAASTRVHGREAVRAYWTREWKEIDPRVEPMRIEFDAAGRAHVHVQQLINSLDGKVLDNREVEHVYEFEGPFIAKMTIVPVAADAEDEE